MRNVDLSLVADYTMPYGLGNLGNHTACFVAQGAILDELSRRGSISKLTDTLECACPVLRVLGIALNDGKWWKGNNERTEVLLPLLPLLLDSRRSPGVTAKRAALAASFAEYAAKSAEYAAESAAKYAESAAEYAAKSAEYAAESAAESAAKYAESAAEYAAEYAEYAAKYAESVAEYAAESAEYAAKYAAEKNVLLRDELLRVWKEIEAIQ